MAIYILDTTALIAHARGDRTVLDLLLLLLRRGHTPATTCVNVDEFERGAAPAALRAYRVFLDRLRFLDTTREAARRAGRYQRSLTRRGRTLHTPDALIAGTARAHGATVITDNVGDFSMPDVRAVTPEQLLDRLTQ